MNKFFSTNKFLKTFNQELTISDVENKIKHSTS